MDIRYVHVQWTATGADDMLPERSARALADAGDVKIIDPTPGPYRRFKPRVPLGEPARPKHTKTRVVTEPAPAGANQPEEASE
jgi:hypothetical protein